MLTKTRIGNFLRRHAFGDQPTFRQGFKEGIAFAEKHAHPAPEAKQEPELIANLSMMVRRLVLSIRRLAEDDSKDLTFANTCLDWLKHKGLAGSPLRDTRPSPEAKQPVNQQLLEANKLLDAALLKTYPQGCDNGEVFDLWNKARAAIAAAEREMK